MTERLSGVMVALATPLNADRSVDEAALERLVAHVLAGGVDGVAPLGSTGEGPAMGPTARKIVLRRVMQAVGGRVPVVPGVTETSLEAAVAGVEQAAAAGAAAVLVAPPSYYPADQAGVAEFFLAVADRSPVPVLIYNIPQMTKVAVAPATVGRLAQHPRIGGIKDSSRDFEYFLQVIAATRAFPGFSCLTGNDIYLLYAHAAGGHGTIAATPNVAPHLNAGLWAAAQAGDMARAARFQEQIMQLNLTCRRGTFPAAWKGALHALGLCGPTTALPMSPLGPDELADLRRSLVALGIVDAGAPA